MRTSSLKWGVLGGPFCGQKNALCGVRRISRSCDAFGLKIGSIDARGCVLSIARSGTCIRRGVCKRHAFPWDLVLSALQNTVLLSDMWYAEFMLPPRTFTASILPTTHTNVLCGE